jgi:azurin/lysophospholipase L1-like esterase
MNRLLLLLLLCLTLSLSCAHAQLQLSDGDRVLLYGNSFIERLQEDGRFEAMMQVAHADKKLAFRSLAWSGDEVGYRLRLEGYPKHLKNLLAKWPANVVILGFGLNESFGGNAGLGRFESDLAGYLNEINRRHPDAKIVLLSPLATEDVGHPHYPDPTARNLEILAYTKAMATVAKQRQIQFVDLYTVSTAAYASHKAPLTDNGIHLNAAGNRAIATHLAELFLGKPAVAKLDSNQVMQVAKAVSVKSGYVATVVRPVNGVLYFGVRARPKEYAAEMPRYHQLITAADAVTHRMAADPATRFDPAPLTLPPLVEFGKTGVSAQKIQQQMKVADGYKVNLFASEDDFPELRNPEQIAFDDRGRLWVVTMPSFPSTIPGDAPTDKIIVLEDSDHDGKADTCTTFADGLTVPDGLAFHEDGVIISHQPRLVFMKDTDGDGKADVERELMRGIDVADAHHGGMIAIGPMGHVMFCDGVFHRSQLETPHGVTRGIDATTYRFDTRRGTVEREYQTQTPNPWKITWDRWGNLFQMYGDGFVQDSHAIPWTPLGVYHPFGRAVSIRYGKGSAAAVISSPNFPDEYQQGVASGVCVRAAFVSLSTHNADGAYYKAGNRLDIVSSPNQFFRPVDIDFGFDGAMYISDFASRIIGHAQNAMRDERWDGMRGRIWRVVHTGKPVVTQWPKIDGASTTELLELLKHPQDNIRGHARRKLRNTVGVTKLIDRWLKGNSQDESVLEALWILHDQNEVRATLLDQLLTSPTPRIRAAGTHLIRFQAGQLEDPLALLKKMAADKHPRVRTEVIHVVSHLQQRDTAYASLLGQIDVSDDNGLKTIRNDASHGAVSGLGPEVPVLAKPRDSKLTHWLLSEGNAPEAPFVFGSKPGAVSTMRTFVSAPKKTRAVLAIKHAYVKVSLNDVPVISAATLWSSDWNVQVELNAGVNEIKVQYIKGRRGVKYAPLYLFDPLGVLFKTLTLSKNDASLWALARAYDAKNGLGENDLRISAVPNQLAFSPTEIRIKAGRTVNLIFDNPDIQLHNLVIVKPGTDAAVGMLADKMAQDADAVTKNYVPDSDNVIWATPLVNSKKKVTMPFTVPKTPGRYPFICSFPGHWRIMKGVIIVD